MAMSLPVTLTATGLPGGLLRASRPLPAGWENGVEFIGDSCVLPERVAICPEDYTGTLDEVGSNTFIPIEVRQGVKCSTLGNPPIERIAGDTLDITDEAALAHELDDGTASGNPSFADAVALAGATTLADAIGLIEASGAVALGGRQILIHVPAGLAIDLPDNCYRDEDGNWRTPLGSIVVLSPGYSGTVVYGTGQTWFAVSDIVTNLDVDRSVNTSEAWATRLGLIAFDPCFNVSVETAESPA